MSKKKVTDSMAVTSLLYSLLELNAESAECHLFGPAYFSVLSPLLTSTKYEGSCLDVDCRYNCFDRLMTNIDAPNCDGRSSMETS